MEEPRLLRGEASPWQCLRYAAAVLCPFVLLLLLGVEMVAADDAHIISCDDQTTVIDRSGSYVLNCSNTHPVHVAGCDDGDGVPPGGLVPPRTVYLRAYSPYEPLSIADASPGSSSGSRSSVANCTVEITILYNITDDEENGQRDTIGVYSPMRSLSIVLVGSSSTHVPLLQIIGGRLEHLLFLALGNIVHQASQSVVAAASPVGFARIHILGHVQSLLGMKLFSFANCSQLEVVVNGSSSGISTLDLASAVLVGVSGTGGVDAASIVVIDATIALSGESSLLHVESIRNCHFCVRRCSVTYTTDSTLFEVQNYRDGAAENATFLLEDSVLTGTIVSGGAAASSPLFDVETCVDPVVVGLDNTTLTITGPAGPPMPPSGSSDLTLLLACARAVLPSSPPPNADAITTACFVNATVDASQVVVPATSIFVVSFQPPVYTSLQLVSSRVRGDAATRSLYVLGNFETNSSTVAPVGFLMVLANATFENLKFVLWLERPTACHPTNQFLHMQCGRPAPASSTWCVDAKVFDLDVLSCATLNASHIRRAPSSDASDTCPLTVLNTTNSANVCDAWSAMMVASRRNPFNHQDAVSAQPLNVASTTEGNYELGVAGRWRLLAPPATAPPPPPMSPQPHQNVRFVGCLPTFYGRVVTELFVEHAALFALTTASTTAAGRSSVFPTTTMLYCSLVVAIEPSAAMATIARPLLNLSDFPFQHLAVTLRGVNLTSSGSAVVIVHDPQPAASLRVVLSNQTSVVFSTPSPPQQGGGSTAAVLRIVGGRELQPPTAFVQVIISDAAIVSGTSSALPLVAACSLVAYNAVQHPAPSSDHSTSIVVARSKLTGGSFDLVAVPDGSTTIRNIRIHVSSTVVDVTGSFHIVAVPLAQSVVTGLVIDVNGGAMRAGGEMILVKTEGLLSLDRFTIDGATVRRELDMMDAIFVHALGSGSNVSLLQLIHVEVSVLQYKALTALIAVHHPASPIVVFLSRSTFDNIGAVWRDPSFIPSTTSVVILVGDCNLWCAPSATSSSSSGAGCTALNVSTTPASVWSTNPQRPPTVETRGSNASAPCASRDDNVPIAISCTADDDTAVVSRAGNYTLNCGSEPSLVLLISGCTRVEGDGGDGGDGGTSQTVSIAVYSPLQSIAIINGNAAEAMLSCNVSITILGQTERRIVDELGGYVVTSYPVKVSSSLMSLEIVVNTTLFVGRRYPYLLELIPSRIDVAVVVLQSMVLSVLENATLTCIDDGAGPYSRCSEAQGNAFSFIRFWRPYTVEPFFYCIEQLTIHVDHLTVRSGFPVALLLLDLSSAPNGALYAQQPTVRSLVVRMAHVNGLWTRPLLVAAAQRPEDASLPLMFTLGATTNVTLDNCTVDLFFHNPTPSDVVSVNVAAVSKQHLLQLGTAAPGADGASAMLINVALRDVRLTAAGCLHIFAPPSGNPLVSSVVHLQTINSNVSIVNGSVLHHQTEGVGGAVVTLCLKNSYVALSRPGNSSNNISVAALSRTRSGVDHQQSRGTTVVATTLDVDNATIALQCTEGCFVWHDKRGAATTTEEVMGGVNISLFHTRIVAQHRLLSTEPLLMWQCGSSDGACRMIDSVVTFVQCTVDIGVLLAHKNAGTVVPPASSSLLLGGLAAMLNTNVSFVHTVVCTSVQVDHHGDASGSGGHGRLTHASLLHIGYVAATSTIRLHDTSIAIVDDAVPQATSGVLFYFIRISESGGGVSSGSGGTLVLEGCLLSGLRRFIGPSDDDEVVAPTNPLLQIALVGCNNSWCGHRAADDEAMLPPPCEALALRNLATAATPFEVRREGQRCATPTTTASGAAPTASTSHSGETISARRSHSFTTTLMLHPPQPVVDELPVGVQAAAVALVAPAAGAVLATSTAGLVQRSMLGIRYSSCGASAVSEEGDRAPPPPIVGSHMPVMENPTRLALGPVHGAMFRGAAVGNIMLLLACVSATALYGYIRATKLGNGVRCMDVLAAVRLPGRLFVVYAVLLQPTITAAAGLVAHGTSTGDYVLGIAVFGVMVVPIVLAAIAVHNGCTSLVRAVERPVDAKHMMLDRIVGRRVEWVPLPNKLAGPSAASFPRNYDTLIGKMRSGRHLFFVVGFVCSIGAGVIGALDPDVEASCYAAQASLVIVSVLSLGSFLVLRPFASVVDLTVNVVLEVLGLVMSVLSVAGAGEAASQGVAFAQLSIAGAMSLLRIAGHALTLAQTTRSLRKPAAGTDDVALVEWVGSCTSERDEASAPAADVPQHCRERGGGRGAHPPTFYRLKQRSFQATLSQALSRSASLQRIMDDDAPWHEGGRRVAAARSGRNGEVQAAVETLRALVAESNDMHCVRREQLSEAGRRRRLMSLVYVCSVFNSNRAVANQSMMDDETAAQPS